MSENFWVSSNPLITREYFSIFFVLFKNSFSCPLLFFYSLQAQTAPQNQKWKKNLQRIIMIKNNNNIQQNISTTKLTQISADCAVRRWKMSPTSLAPVECLWRKNTRSAKIKWLLICTTVYVEFMDEGDEQWCIHKPEMIENDHVNIPKDHIIETTFTVIDKETRKFFLTDMAIPDNHSTRLKKLTSSRNKVGRMWDVQTTIVSVFIGNLGFISLNLKSYIKKIRIRPHIPWVKESAFYCKYFAKVLSVWHGYVKSPW